MPSVLQDLRASPVAVGFSVFATYKKGVRVESESAFVLEFETLVSSRAIVPRSSGLQCRCLNG